jgi:nucleoside-diphosphate-sugar epimerase
MKVLLTGYTGVLGRHLARVLKSEGFSVRVILHRRTVAKKDFRREADELLWGSIDDPQIIREAVHGVQGVVHSAWKFSSQSAQRPTFNEIATEQLFRESIAAGVEKFAFISSVAVYGMRPKQKSIISETSPLAWGKELAY